VERCLASSVAKAMEDKCEADWSGAAFDRCQTARTVARKNRGTTQRLVAGGSRKRFFGWIVGTVFDFGASVQT